jgi:hypothetical protein
MTIKSFVTATTAQDIDLEKFVTDVVDSWDMDTLKEFAIEQMLQNYEATPQDQLIEEYNNFYEQ